MTIKHTISFLLFFCSYVVIAQKFTFRQMDARQGLPASEVYNLHQDRQGYIWAFTEYGIMKHNGTRFIPVCRNLPFSQSAIYKVAESPDGVMYIANSNAKIYRIAGDSAVLLKGLEKIAARITEYNKTILYLTIDETTIWFGSNDHSYQYDLKSHRVKWACTNKKTNEITFQTIGKKDIALKCVHVNGWKEKCLLRLVDSRDSLLFSLSFFYNLSSRNGIVRNRNRYYIMSLDAVMLAGPKGILKKQQFNRTVLSVELAPNGYLWQGLAYGGLYELDSDLNILHHYLPGITVSDILFDNQGGMWVATIGRGIFYCPNRQSTSFDEIPELSENITLLKVVGKQLFIGTASGKLFVYRDKRLRNIPLRETDVGVNDIIAYEGNYLIGARSGIFKLNGQMNRIRIFAGSSGYGAYTFAEQKNKRLLILSAGNILEKALDSDQLSNQLRAQKPRCVVVRKDGVVFVRTGKGLFVLKNKKLVLPDYLNMLKGKNISRICFEKEQDLWICTSGNGLFRLSATNQLIHCINLPSSVIRDICFLRNKDVIVATNKGAFITSMNKGRFGSWVQLVDNEVVNVEEFEDQLYFGTKLGLTVLNKEGLLKKPLYPFYIESVRAGRKTISPENMQLKYFQNQLYFNFDLLAYYNAEKRLLYTLNGPSPGKGAVNGTQLHLQNLAPGQYKLQVYPANYLENSRQKGWTTSFYIAPAFWQTKLFLFVVIALSALAIILVTRFVLSRSRRKAEVRGQVTRMLAVYRLTALKAQINPHFISNSLAAIQELVITDQTDKANQYLARFSLLIRYLLNYSDQSVASLGDELKIIELIIELEQLRFSNQFVFRKEITKDVEVEDLFIPPLITQPFIENAIWHGLLPLKGKRIPELVLKVVQEEERLIISIIDNGVGRRSQQSKNRDGHESKGTGLIQHRIDNLNKLHTAKGAFIEFTDLEDRQGEPTGTRVDIIFPTDMLNTLYDEQDQEHYY